MTEFKASVIIPVYNAAKYMAQAVQSALEQPETGEVILVEDASPDDSLTICRELVAKYAKVRLLQHAGGANRGAGPSRNLGIENSQFDHLAFLDADDYYLPHRFAVAREIFKTDPECEGVYEAVGIQFEDELARQRWLASDMANIRVTMVTRMVAPEDLFKLLMQGGSGHIHLNGLTIKKSILERSGTMNEEIADTLHEDTDFILKLAAVGKLLPGSLEKSVAIRRVHTENRVSAVRPSASIYRDHMRQRVATYRWCKKKGLKEQQELAFRRMALECILNKPIHPNLIMKLPKAYQKTTRLVAWPFEAPEVVLKSQYWLGLARSVLAFIRNPDEYDAGL